ncbi:hypothetical protein PV325_010776, partial [Microctonus aethiopoides]
DKENNLNIPLILNHGFKDIKQVYGSDVNVSAIWNLCSKVIKGSVTSATNFLTYLKRKGHSDLLQAYEKVKNSNLKKRKHTEISSSGSELAVIHKKLKQSTLTDVESGSKSVNLDILVDCTIYC